MSSVTLVRTCDSQIHRDGAVADLYYFVELYVLLLHEIR